jgi:hypothetical protein
MSQHDIDAIADFFRRGQNAQKAVDNLLGGKRKGNEEELRAALRRVCNSLATFIRQDNDPGTEALAALYEAQRLL